MNEKFLYLDNASTTKISNEVFAAMLPHLKEEYGNASSKYYDLAIVAKNAIKKARTQISECLFCEDDEIIFTSGATEANNQIIKGIAFKDGEKRHFITSNVEHPSVLETFRFIEMFGHEVTYLPANSKGVIETEDLRNCITEATSLVSIMWVNNELGSINDIETISRVCKDKGVLFHTDATQAIGKIRINEETLDCVEAVTISGHKIGGPKGIGALIFKRDSDGVKRELMNLLHGGEQQDYRAGTLPTPLIVGLGEAVVQSFKNTELNVEMTRNLDSYFIELLDEKFGERIEVINRDFERVSGIVSIRFIGILNQLLLKKLKDYVAASTGSACSVTKPSYVLSNIGMSSKELSEVVRFSFNSSIEKDDLKKFIDLL